MPTLCIPRRKSILIETIHHSRRPTDVLLFLRLQPGLMPARNTRVDRSGAIASSSSSSSLCRSDFLRDSILPDFAEFRPNGRFWFISSVLRPRAVPRIPFFTARGIMRQQDSPAFAEFRRRNAPTI